MDQALNSQKTPHTSPLRASYGMSFVSILMKNDRVIKGFYCISIRTPKWNSKAHIFNFLPKKRKGCHDDSLSISVVWSHYLNIRVLLFFLHSSVLSVLMVITYAVARNHIQNLPSKSYVMGLPVLNSSPPSAAYMRHWIGSALVHIIACRLFGAKPLSKPILAVCQLDL